jgi:hexosaminidase
MGTFSIVAVFLIIVALTFSVTAQSAINVIPAPSRVSEKSGYFQIKPTTAIAYGEGTHTAAKLLAQRLGHSTGYEPEVISLALEKPREAIVLRIDPSLKHLGEEGYMLESTEQQIEIVAATDAGVFYGTQTLLQLLPEQVYSRKPVSATWKVPCVEIEDQPRYAWRGSLLDCCRHFFDKEFVKKYIDLLAMHKMNVLHWHLTEDQGWRIEIKKYPKLTEIGAWRDENGKKYGGFYSQKDVKEIVAYATERHVRVVPEIEMPGHAMAALAAYPEYSCTGGPFKVQTGWGVFADVYCAGNDKTFEFLQDVLTEVFELFPSKYIHIGGDESPKSVWEKCPKCQDRIKAEGLKNEHELQSYFIRRAEKFLNENGRSLIGWDEILEGGLAPNATVQSWRGIGGGIASAQQGHDVIMSPTSHCYLDSPYTSLSTERVYSYEPTPAELKEEQAKHVLGVEGNLWAEWMNTSRDVESKAFPRLSALSEVAWSNKTNRDWTKFRSRLEVQLKRLKRLDVAYFDEPLLDSVRVGEWKPAMVPEKAAEADWDVTSAITSGGKMEALFVYQSGAHALAIKWVALYENGVEVARDTHNGWSGASLNDIVYHLTLEKLKPGATYTLKALVAGEGGTDSNGVVTLRVKAKK